MTTPLFEEVLANLERTQSTLDQFNVSLIGLKIDIAVLKYRLKELKRT